MTKKTDTTVEQDITRTTQQKHYEVDMRIVRPLERAGGNLRIDYGEEDGSFQELIDSIRENGIRNAIQAYRDPANPELWILIDGHRRHKAAMWLIENEGLTVRVNLLPVDRKTLSDEKLIIDMFTTNTGKQLGPLEMAEGVRRLRAQKLEIKDISQKLGLDRRYVRNLELLGGAPKRIRDLIFQNKIGWTVALSFIKSSEDYTDAIAQIEKAFNVAKGTQKKSGSKPTIEGAEPGDVLDADVKITRAHLNEVTNRVDSFAELRKVFKKQIDTQQEPKDVALYSVLKKLVDNKLIASDIEKLLF
jgi:ParB/RepB/Spo0J family partition protein